MSEKFHFSPRANKASDIKWREWGKEAFVEAMNNDKLILLSISAQWCHWCHVMDETSYSYRLNINLINDEFIPIRVDNDKRPDINRRFNMGGWPSTAILTPGGDIINGGTYLPEKDLYMFLANTLKQYKSNHYIDDKDNEVYDNKIGSISPQTENTISEKTLEYIDNILRGNFDTLHGGFGIEPKFPHTDALNYLINRFGGNTKSEMFSMVTKTLNSMYQGGICDKIDGGFFRYSTTRDWSIPHYEKMLEDNCKLLDIYLKAYTITNEKKYSDICNSIIKYLNNNLLDNEKGIFAGSQDANEFYYSLESEERKKQNKPFIDKTMYTNWNALAISVYTRAYYILDYSEGLNIAKRTMSFILDNCVDSNGCMFHYYTDSPQLSELLEDQIMVINALIDLYEVTNNNKYIYTATNLADIVLEKFYDSTNGGFYDDIVDAKFITQFESGEKSLFINSTCCQVMYRLFDYSNLEKYKEAAEKTINLFSIQFIDYDYLGVGYGNAVLRYFKDPVKITIVGDREDKITIDMHLESLRKHIPFKIIEMLDTNKDREIIDAYGYNNQKLPVGYVCKGTTCVNPSFSVPQFVNALNNSVM